MTKFIKASHDKSILTVQYVRDNGDILLRSGGTIAWRFNNPGNMRPKSTGTYPGQIGVGDTKSGKFVIFDSYDSGRKEKKALLRRKYNNYTLSEALHIYAPVEENNTEEYIRFLVKKTGIQRNTKLSSLNDSSLELLMDAMQDKEGFNGLKDSRKEHWVKTTAVNLNNGIKPLANQKVNVVINGEKKELITNIFGNLPLIPHLKEGEKLTFTMFFNGVEENIGEVITSIKSQSVSLVNTALRYSTKLIPQNGKIENNSKVFSYIVVSGDSLSKIAKRFHVTSSDIQLWNKLKNPNNIYPGQLLVIGGDKKKTSNATQKYKVKQGDTASNICKRYSISLVKFQKINPQIKNINSLKVNQLVNIESVDKTFDQTKNAITDLLENIIVRSKMGTGEGLALLPLSNNEAPWMTVVLRELKQWYGKKENVITKTDNYHELTGTKLNTMVGSSQAWCASFANYCLQEARYSKSNQPASALSFRRDSKNFTKIDVPIYGALATIPTSKGANPNATSGAGHVGFVYALSKSAGNFIMIGGNQDDQITIVERSISSFRFYVPKTYSVFAKTQNLENKISVDELYSLLGLKTIKTGSGTR